MPIPFDIKQLRGFLPYMARRIRPITTLVLNGATFKCTALEDTVRPLLVELTTPPILVFLDWSAVTDRSRPFFVYYNVNIASFGATLEQEQCDGSIRSIVYISQATLANEQN